jgi:putative membrane protein
MRVRASLALALAAIGGSGVLVVSTTERGGELQQIALVNEDAGPIGERIVAALRDTGRFVVETPNSSNATRSAHGATIILLPDLSATVGSLASNQPRRARLELRADPEADPARVDSALAEVTSQVRLEGIRETLSTVRAARELIGQAQLTTRVLRAGVDDAAGTSDRFRKDADHMLSSLTQAKRRANQIQSQIAELDAVADDLGGRLIDVAGALDRTGVTVGQIVAATSQLNAGLSQVVPALRSLPFAHDPAVAPIITKLEALQGLAAQTDEQLYGFAGLAGVPVSPDTRISTLVSEGAAKLSSTRAELNASVDFARDVPRLADEGAAQLISAQQQLDDGLRKMGTVLGNLDKLTSNALSALPEPGRGIDAIAAVVDQPVDVVRT